MQPPWQPPGPDAATAAQLSRKRGREEWEVPEQLQGQGQGQ
eukprot:CAMPEP_0202918026 /NCGR_PEP_ID=MMETSP1392-20130828/72476_1 /ASSEMBLY_ACC=CAM_ASM_000868 /TAXON_ID=225041 /ORGANISM="Chlamydomonas chlamydogama, Strain SAG 11-48b" /LENGTH=40 /DNA_ID= /DNA_START= /DNA_END= /DNA_ORIENTATION=